MDVDSLTERYELSKFLILKSLAKIKSLLFSTNGNSHMPSSSSVKSNIVPDTDAVYISLIKFDLNCTCFYQLNAYAHIVDHFGHTFIFSEDTIVIDLDIPSLGMEPPVCFKLHRSKLHWVFHVSENITKLGKYLSETRNFLKLSSFVLKLRIFSFKRK